MEIFLELLQGADNISPVPSSFVRQRDVLALGTQSSKLQSLYSAFSQMWLEVKEASFSFVSFKHSFSGQSFKIKTKCIWLWVRTSTNSLIALNILGTCKKTYLTENNTTETEAEYQWMQGAYIHVTGSKAKTQCLTSRIRTRIKWIRVVSPPNHFLPKSFRPQDVFPLVLSLPTGYFAPKTWGQGWSLSTVKNIFKPHCSLCYQPF